MRFTSACMLMLCLAACHSGTQQSDAVRQGVIDYLGRMGLNVAGMDVTMTSLKVNGNQADAAVSITAKGGNAGQGMQMQYQLEQKDGKWVVVGREGSNQHGVGPVAPGTANPHGAGSPAAMPDASSPPAGAKMPSPEDLPPATKKPASGNPAAKHP